MHSARLLPAADSFRTLAAGTQLVAVGRTITLFIQMTRTEAFKQRDSTIVK